MPAYYSSPTPTTTPTWRAWCPRCGPTRGTVIQVDPPACGVCSCGRPTAPRREDDLDLPLPLDPGHLPPAAAVWLATGFGPEGDPEGTLDAELHQPTSWAWTTAQGTAHRARLYAMGFSYRPLHRWPGAADVRWVRACCPGHAEGSLHHEDTCR